jgi:hypothetical protein
MAKMLEEGRVRAVEIYKQRERSLIEQKRAGNDVLLAQIEDHKRSAKLETQRREAEKMEMDRAYQASLEEDKKLAEERSRRKREFLGDCLEARQTVLRRKQREKERDIQEVQAMVEYQKEQAAKEAARDAEVAKIKALKDRDVAEVRKLQQRAIDTQAQQDEIRARMVQELQEKKAREKELETAKKRQEMIQNLRKDRLDAIAAKERRLIDMAKIEKADYDRVVEAQRRAREKARQEYEERRSANERWREELLRTLAAREEERRTQPLRNLDESKHMDEVRNDYLARLERIRQKKLDVLREEGVPEQYLVDLKARRFLIK